MSSIGGAPIGVRTPRRFTPSYLEGVIFVARAKPREVSGLGFFDFLRPIVPAQSPERIGAVEDEAINSLGVPRGVGDRDRPAPAGR